MLYFEKVNATGGVFGRKISFISYDDHFEEKRASANIKTLVEKDKVFALFRPFGTAAALAAIPLVREYRIPLIAFSGAPETRVADPYVIHFRASYWDEIDQIVNLNYRIGTRRILLVYQNDQFGESIKRGFEKAIASRPGMADLPSVPMKVDSSDLDAALKYAAERRPEVIIMGLAGKPVVKFVGEYHKQAGSARLAGLSVVMPELLIKHLGNEGARGTMLVEVMPFIGGGTTVVDEYRRAASAAGKEISYIGLEGYLSAKITVEGLRLAGRELTRDGFVQAIRKMRGLDFGGYAISFGGGENSGSKYTDLVIISHGGRLVH